MERVPETAPLPAPPPQGRRERKKRASNSTSTDHARGRSRPTWPAVYVDCALTGLAFDDRFDLAHGFQRLVFDRLRRQAADMRGGDDVGKLRKLRTWHLVGRAADIHRGTGDTILEQRLRQRRFVDEVAAREIDEDGMLLHARQRRLADQ